MLRVDTPLPAGAVLGQTRMALAHTLALANAVWFQGQTGRFDLDGDAVTGWQSNTVKAVQTEPNSGNSRLSDSGLQFTSQTHSGLVAPRITPNAARWSMAVIYTPQDGDDPRTLLTLNTGTCAPEPDVSNYMYLSHADGDLTVKDTQDGIGMITRAAPQTGRHMAVVTLSGGQLAVAQGLNDPTMVKGASIGFDAPADLFIGCRSHRGGLKKTLGNALVHDVIFWPNHTLLIPRGAADVAQYTALKRFHLWNAA